MAGILSGAPVAEALTAGLTVRSRALRERGVVPTLVILRVGEQEASRSYERAAKRACTAAGVEAFSVVLPEEAGREAVLHAVRSINKEPGVHGALLLRPMPELETERAACAELSASKDVDGISRRRWPRCSRARARVLRPARRGRCWSCWTTTTSPCGAAAWR